MPFLTDDDLKSLVTHRFKLGELEEAHDLFGRQPDGAIKVAISP
jgi:threonine dehydrogenase-like Zn-dependent dehydrogenase